MSDERSLVAQIAAHTSWSKTPDRSARTAPARAGLDARFEREVDPDGVLTPSELARRVDSARKAYFAELALKSARSRRKAADARAAAPRLDAEADAALVAHIAALVEQAPPLSPEQRDRIAALLRSGGAS